ncbi:MAG: hypothetical protein J6Y91_02095 [Alphaproteobacteria bacterium]|nr:hypothetical protein [Alphaproteobacteria bacterium]
MPKKKENFQYSYAESLQMLNQLQKMAIDEGNLNLAIKAEELKCKIASLQAQENINRENNEITKILVDFINEKQNSENSGDICAADTSQEEI